MVDVVGLNSNSGQPIRITTNGIWYDMVWNCCHQISLWHFVVAVLSTNDWWLIGQSSGLIYCVLLGGFFWDCGLSAV